MVEAAWSAETDRLLGELAELARRGACTVAVAESLTGGQLAAALASAPDAGEWFRGGVVAYHPEVKYALLDAPRGPVVTGPTAAAMARSAAALLGADAAVAVTGVGGPEPSEGEPAGTVYLAVCSGEGEGGAVTSRHEFDGEPSAVMRQTIEAALRALIERARDRADA